MKLILTSGSISNKSLENELKSVIGKDFKDLKMLFCTTASNYAGGEMNDWLIEDLNYFKDAGFKIDICDISGIGIEKFLPRFEWADVYFFEGGDTQWLISCIKSSGLEEHLTKLLETRVWIGASAGSCALCPAVCSAYKDLFDENLWDYPADGLGFVDFRFIPHLNSEWFPEMREEKLRNAIKNIKKADDRKFYVLDDDGAVFVDGENVKVISEGTWFEA